MHYVKFTKETLKNQCTPATVCVCDFGGDSACAKSYIEHSPSITSRRQPITESQDSELPPTSRSINPSVLYLGQFIPIPSPMISLETTYSGNSIPLLFPLHHMFTLSLLISLTLSRSHSQSLSSAFKCGLSWSRIDGPIHLSAELILFPDSRASTSCTAASALQCTLHRSGSNTRGLSYFLPLVGGFHCDLTSFVDLSMLPVSLPTL